MLTKRILVVGYLFSLLLLNLVHTTESTSYQEEAVTIKEQRQSRRGRRSGNGQSRGRRRCDPLYRYLFETCGHWPFPTAPSLDNPFLPFKPPPSQTRPRPSPRLAPPLVPSPPPPPPSPLVPSPPPPSPPPFFVFPSPPPPVIVNFPPPLVPSPPPPLVSSPPPPLVPSPPPPQSGGSMMQPPPLWLPPPSSQYETPPIFSLPPQEDAFLTMPPIVWVPPPDVTA